MEFSDRENSGYRLRIPASSRSIQSAGESLHSAYKTQATPEEDFSPRREESPYTIPASHYISVQSDVSTQSRAVSHAMRALQDRIRLLETENAQLKQAYETIEDQSLRDRERWQERLMEEMKNTREQEFNQNRRISDLDQEVRDQATQIAVLQEQLKIATSSCSFTEGENRRQAEQFALDKENWDLQLQAVRKKLTEKTKEVKALGLQFQQSETEKERHYSDLVRYKENFEKLQREHTVLRSKLGRIRQQHSDTLNELNTKNTKTINELQNKIRMLENQNKSLREKNYVQSATIKSQAKVTNENMSPRKAEARSKSNKRLQSAKPKRKTAERPPQQSSPQGILRNKTDSRPFSAASTERTVYQSKSIDFGDKAYLIKRISNLDEEIQRLNGQYKALLTQSSVGDVDFAALRVELDQLANIIDEKSNELYALKKNQHDYLIREAGV